jgi:enoyl-CoA hydratase/carnithine racemase
MDLFRVEPERSGHLPGILTLWLDQGDRPVVVLDEALIRRLETTLAALPGNAEGLVLASAAPRAFVAGADLSAIADLSDDHLHRYLQFGSRVFAMLCALPYPTAAAIHAAALGGGLELAMHCDGLIASRPEGKPYPVGLPEAGLSICPGWGGTNLLPARMAPDRAIRLTAEGRTMAFDEAAGEGLFDAVAGSRGELIEAARGWIRDRGDRSARNGLPRRWIGAKAVAPGVLRALDTVRPAVDAAPGRAVCEAIDTGLAKGWAAALACEQRHLVRLRSAPAGREAIRAFFERSAGRP